jgi:chorismate mutase
MTHGVDLEILRDELDRIDERLLDALSERIRCCVRIAEFKRENDVPMMQPHRITVVQDRAAAFARVHGIDETFISRFYELIIAETCRVEDLVIEDAGTEKSD